MAEVGFLTPEAEKRLKGEDDLKISNVSVVRAYAPTREAFEYTLFFKDEQGKKHRTDFDIDQAEIAGILVSEREDYVLRRARAAIMGELDG